MFKRLQTFPRRKHESAFLWGARQTGKSTLLKELYPKAPLYDLLLSDEYARLSRKPQLLREELSASPPPKGMPVVIDEVQKCPALLDEVQWLIVNQKISFILSGSSARKLKRTGANLLGGRALRYELFPLVSAEIPHFNLERALNNGLLPRHYQAPNAEKLLASYLGDYLKEEIAAEALARNIPLFARFLDAAAFSNGEMLNYQNIATDCGISPPTVKEYFQILEDTLLARTLPTYRKKPKRRVIQAPKFYFFDVGVANHLLKRGKVVEGSESFGKAFEHFLFQEIWAHSRYSGLDYPVCYWRTASQLEVDFILGDHEVAVEVKSTASADERHLRGLRAFQEEYQVKEALLVSRDPKPRKTGNIRILPWAVFLEELWSGRLLS
jgi:predicted AAA+ superfamily ATPase